MRSKGLTLVEVLIAGLILAVAIVPVIQIFSSGIVGGVKTKDLRIAMNLAAEEMEVTKNLDLPEKDISNEEKTKTVGAGNWRIVREIVDGTDPLEIWVKVYRAGESEPKVKLVSLREDLKW